MTSAIKDRVTSESRSVAKAKRSEAEGSTPLMARRAIKGGVTAYLLYNGSATYVL